MITYGRKFHPPCWLKQLSKIGNYPFTPPAAGSEVNRALGCHHFLGGSSCKDLASCWPHPHLEKRSAPHSVGGSAFQSSQAPFLRLWLIFFFYPNPACPFPTTGVNRKILPRTPPAHTYYIRAHFLWNPLPRLGDKGHKPAPKCPDCQPRSTL